MADRRESWCGPPDRGNKKPAFRRAGEVLLPAKGHGFRLQCIVYVRQEMRTSSVPAQSHDKFVRPYQSGLRGPKRKVHFKGKGADYTFSTVEKLMADFLADVRRLRGEA